MSYPAISLATATAGRHRRPPKRLQTAANLPSTRIRARIIAPVTPSPPSAVLTPSIPVHRWIRDKRRENLGLAVEWRVAMRPGSRRKLEPGSEEALEEKAKASVRAKVEHTFLRLKRLFGYGEVRYRGLAKNMERLALLFGLGNLLTAEGQLAA